MASPDETSLRTMNGKTSQMLQSRAVKTYVARKLQRGASQSCYTLRAVPNGEEAIEYLAGTGLLRIANAVHSRFLSFRTSTCRKNPALRFWIGFECNRISNRCPF